MTEHHQRLMAPSSLVIGAILGMAGTFVEAPSVPAVAAAALLRLSLPGRHAVRLGLGALPERRLSRRTRPARRTPELTRGIGMKGRMP